MRIRNSKDAVLEASHAVLFRLLAVNLHFGAQCYLALEKSCYEPLIIINP